MTWSAHCYTGTIRHYFVLSSAIGDRFVSQIFIWRPQEFLAIPITIGWCLVLHTFYLAHSPWDLHSIYCASLVSHRLLSCFLRLLYWLLFQYFEVAPEYEIEMSNTGLIRSNFLEVVVICDDAPTLPESSNSGKVRSNSTWGDNALVTLNVKTSNERSIWALGISYKAGAKQQIGRYLQTFAFKAFELERNYRQLHIGYTYTQLSGVGNFPID